MLRLKHTPAPLGTTFAEFVADGALIQLAIAGAIFYFVRKAVKKKSGSAKLGTAAGIAAIF